MSFVSEAQILAACTYQLGQCINSELLLALQREVPFLWYDIINTAWKTYVFGKKNSPLWSSTCNQEALF